MGYQPQVGTSTPNLRLVVIDFCSLLYCASVQMRRDLPDSRPAPCVRLPGLLERITRVRRLLDLREIASYRAATSLDQIIHFLELDDRDSALGVSRARFKEFRDVEHRLDEELMQGEIDLIVPIPGAAPENGFLHFRS
jgi:hypothetical protein